MHFALNRKYFGRGLALASTTALCLSLGTGAAVAQDEDLEEITVTGSRIARDPNLGAPVAVQSVNAEQIQLSGEMDIADIVREMPALMTSNTGDASALGGDFDSDDQAALSSVGEAVLQLRGMGLERTLVLVDGRRHVPGGVGSAAVDINTIPQQLIERVEVLTGGASAIYGADAVTGVVNFIMKDEYEGLEFGVQGGMSSEGDGEDYSLSGIWGTNFADDRGNFAIAVDYRKREHLSQGDRDWSRDNGIASDDANPALRFQDGDIGGSTPNLQQFYTVARGYFPFGLEIPSSDDFIASYTADFGMAPTLTAEEMALFDQAANAPLGTVMRHRTFSISSEHGVIVPADFLNSNGIDDCDESFLGYNSLFEGVEAFGLTGGCWNNVNGVPQIYQDGLVAGHFNQFGGDGIHALGFDEDYLTPDDEKITVNLSARYELTDSDALFAEVKFVTQDSEFGGPNVAFYDLLYGAPDNPFIPAELQAAAANAGGLYITRDPIDLGDWVSTNERETVRFVLGMEGELDNGWGYELSINAGKTELTNNSVGGTIMDRYFAAIDVTTDGAGNPICRSDVDPTPPPTTIFDLPLFDPGFFTFNPGDGTCVPLNIWGGSHSSTPEAVDWIMRTEVQEFQIEQAVFSAIIDGDLPFGLDAGNVAFAAGAEVRGESSKSTFDPWTRGVLPVDGPNGKAGTLLRDIPGFRQTSLMFDPETLVTSSTGNFYVWDLFGEIAVPLLEGASFAEELSFSAALRYSDYSTIGNTITWQAGLVWAPVEDIRFRGTVSQSVRAPNIAELFNPEQAQTFRPRDPCEQFRIDALIADGDPTGAIRQANCIADGLAMGFVDPLSARFTGATSGNPDLSEEEADTITIGFVFQPSFLEGLTVSVDYWDIEINDAIEAVSAQDIVNSCYDAPTFPNQFCELLRRDRNPASPQFLGLEFIQQTQLNFGKIESAGIDFAASYAFELGASSFVVGAQGTKVDHYDRFFDPIDPSAIDPELGELRRPELSGSANLTWGIGPFTAQWQSLYQDSQTLFDVEIQTAMLDFGLAGFADDFWSHDLSLAWDVNEGLRVYGGVNNVTDEIPFLTEIAYPVSPRGQYFFLGLNYAMQ
jgi:outer membrane receptor protein involved in Fe transport